MPENVKFNIHCIYSLFEECRPYVLISDVMASIRKEKIPKRWYTRPCRTECKTGTEKPGWPVWTGWPGWLCLMMGGGVLIKICSKAVRSHLHFWWSWWWWWRWQWWRTLSHIDAQKPIYGIKYLWEFGCTPSSSSSSSSSVSSGSHEGDSQSRETSSDYLSWSKSAQIIMKQ